MKRRTKIIIGIVVIGAVAGGGFFAYRARQPKGTRVRTVEVERADLVSLVTANGTVEAQTKVDLSANIMGQITLLDVEEGQTVGRGDLLLLIDQARYSAAVDSRRSALEALEAELEWAREAAAQAERDFDRAERQYREQILAAADYDRLKSVYEQQRVQIQRVDRQVAQARADLAAATDELAKTEIRAPMSGIVTRLNVEQGEVVVTGTMNNPGTVLMTISDMSTIEAVLEMDQTDVPLLEIGQPAAVLIDAFPDTPFDGVVSEIGNSPIRESSTPGLAATGTDYEVKVTLTTRPDLVRPGLTVTADITTATRDNVLKVPIGALVLRDEAEQDEEPASDDDERLSSEAGRQSSVASRSRDVQGIYVVEAGKVEFRPVRTGIKGELEVELLEGLDEGEEIVTGPFKALRELNPGDEVVVDNTPRQELDT